MDSAIVFDDGRSSLGPLTDLRPSFAVRTGALTTLERLALLLKIESKTEVKGLWVPRDLVEVTREMSSIPVNDLSSIEAQAKSVLLVNGRCPVTSDEIGDLRVGGALIAGDSVVAARLTMKDAAEFLATMTLPDGTKSEVMEDAGLIEWPWDVIRFRDEALEIDLQALLTRPSQELPAGVVGIDDEQIRISPEALVYPGVVLDAGSGPIFIDDHATIRPGAVIIGPVSIGVGSTVLDRALIKGHTAIGPVCKVAGEVGGTIFQGLANKAHDGHLGDSWVGEWANLGAGTTNSNLLNTYGEIVAQVEPSSSRQRTGMQFLGAIIGDHVKFAIMTRIMTGSVFGTGSMIAAGNPPTAVGRFEWITDDRRQPYRFEKFMEVAKAAMSRRSKAPSEAYVARLRQLSEPKA